MLAKVFSLFLSLNREYKLDTFEWLVITYNGIRLDPDLRSGENIVTKDSKMQFFKKKFRIYEKVNCLFWLLEARLLRTIQNYREEVAQEQFKQALKFVTLHVI